MDDVKRVPLFGRSRKRERETKTVNERKKESKKERETDREGEKGHKEVMKERGRKEAKR